MICSDHFETTPFVVQPKETGNRPLSPSVAQSAARGTHRESITFVSRGDRMSAAKDK